MKHGICRLSALLMALALIAAPALAEAPGSIAWNKVISLPSASEIQAFRGTARAPYICCQPEFSGVTAFYEFSVDFRADHLPRGTYLCVSNFGFNDAGLLKRYASVKRDYEGVAGYAGFQKYEDGTTGIILTVWDSYCYDRSGRKITYQATQVYPAGNKGFEVCVGNTVTGEGCFVHTLLPYNWVEGRNYRALLQLTNPTDGANSHLIFWACDLQTGAWTRLVEYDLGYSGTYMYWTTAFLEDFSYHDAGSLRSMVLSNFRVHATSKAEWVTTKKATFSCNYSNGGSYQYGSAGNAFYTITTGLPNRCSRPADRKTYTVSSCEGGSPYQ